MADLQRLHRLVEILVKVRDEARPLNMDYWVGSEETPDDIHIPSLDVPVHECGTASCALGWAARDPDFNKQGLHFFDLSTRYDDCVGYNAGREFFGLTWDEAYELFDPDAYPSDVTVNDVIDRVMDVIERHASEAKEIASQL